MLTPDEANEFMEAKGRKDIVMLPRYSMQLDTRMYGNCEMTKWPYVEGQSYLDSLESGEVKQPEQNKEEPVYCDEHQAVRARYVKKVMPYTIWDRQYSKMPGYHFLHRDQDEESQVHIAFTRLLYESERDGRNLPEGIELLEDWELDLLKRKTQAA